MGILRIKTIIILPVLTAFLVVLGVMSIVESGAKAQSPPPDDSITLISTNNLANNRPIIVSDLSGRFHAFWTARTIKGNPALGDTIYHSRWDGNGWSQPLDVLVSPGSSQAEELSAAVDQSNKIHLAWRGNVGGRPTIFYSRAAANRAGSARAWTEPKKIAFPRDSPTLSLAIGPNNVLHLVYSEDVSNTGSLFYLQSKDGGISWGGRRLISGAGGYGKAPYYPKLATDLGGCLHLAWVEYALPGGWPPLGVFYAKSCDQGGTWKYTFAHLGQYSYIRPIVLDSQNILLSFSGSAVLTGRYLASSTDAGMTWSIEDIFPSISGLAGNMPILVDSAGTFHVLTTGLAKRKLVSRAKRIMGSDHLFDWPYYSQRSGQNWSDLTPLGDPDVAAHFADGAISQGNRIAFVWQDVLNEDNRGIYAWVFTTNTPSRIVELPSPIAQLTKTLAPTPTPTPTPTSASTSETTPTPDSKMIHSNQSQSSSMAFPLEVGTTAAFLVILLIVGIRNRMFTDR